MTQLLEQAKCKYRFKGDTEWECFPDFPTVDCYCQLFVETFLANYSSCDEVLHEDDLSRFIDGEITLEEFKSLGYTTPTIWQANEERKTKRQIIIEKACECFYIGVATGRIEISAKTI